LEYRPTLGTPCESAKIISSHYVMRNIQMFNAMLLFQVPSERLRPLHLQIYDPKYESEVIVNLCEILLIQRRFYVMDIRELWAYACGCSVDGI